jgi:hypothetical protein
MTGINVNLGDAFLLETPPNDQHLYIAIAKTSAEKYLFVNVTTRRAKSDLSCILQPDTEGIPNFVKRESVINYLDAREMNVEQLARVITTKILFFVLNNLLNVGSVIVWLPCQTAS